MPTDMSDADMFIRAFKGFVKGDAFGSPFEGLSPEGVEQRLKYFKRRGKIISNPTDDSIQMLTLAESISDTVYFSPEDFAERLRMCYEAGLISKIGPTSIKALEKLKLGYSWKKSGVEVNTCGSAMRVMPIGLLYSFDLNLVEKYAVMQSLITHTGKEAIASSVAIAIIFACLCEKLGFEESIEIASDFCSKYDAYTSILIRKILNEKYEYRGSMLASDVIAAAIQCSFESKNYCECVRKAIKLGGDTDTVAAIAGAIKAILSKSEIKTDIELEIDEKFEKRTVETAKKLWNVHVFIR